MGVKVLEALGDKNSNTGTRCTTTLNHFTGCSFIWYFDILTSESMAYSDLSDSSYKKTNDAVKAKSRWLQAESLPDLQECVIDCSST
jgi:hypothetical protein